MPLVRVKPLRKINWVAYAKPPFAGPEEVLTYLSRYTHRVAIANSRLLKFNDQGVTFKWKDYRAKPQFRNKIMTLKTDEFIRRFLIHVLPSGFHRIPPDSPLWITGQLRATGQSQASTGAVDGSNR
jgi:hypothetical protein